ncbi:hypothetical protein UFOVP116_292 [uncultured Caudovirales phage]|uniref:Uncharacterized protein n=1 Tax=uncultured Caudovirales phage TaxID=2100421 RepID=A0A6J5L808_9CAUD|nr:hypothetical protein UFOVP116_292 [uncultured Caudovirales phage]
MQELNQQQTHPSTLQVVFEMFEMSTEKIAELIDWCKENIGSGNWGIMLSTHWGKVSVRIDNPKQLTIAAMKFA